MKVVSGSERRLLSGLQTRPVEVVRNDLVDLHYPVQVPHHVQPQPLDPLPLHELEVGGGVEEAGGDDGVGGGNGLEVELAVGELGEEVGVGEAGQVRLVDPTGRGG